MIPDYTSSFDIIVSAAATDSGAITSCVKTNPNCSTYLIGESASPGAKDTTDPWPPYQDNYLFTNFDGDDPSTPNGQRTFQPYWTEFVAADPAPEIRTADPLNIKERDMEELMKVLPVAGGAEFPEDLNEYPRMPAGGGEGMAVTQAYEPKALGDMRVGAGSDGSGDGGGSADGNGVGAKGSNERRHARSF